MKLPTYYARNRVQGSLGRARDRGAGIERPTDWGALSRFGTALGNLGYRMQQEEKREMEEAAQREAAEQYNTAWVDYLNERNDSFLKMTTDRLKDVPVDPANPDGPTRKESRHSDLPGEYTEMESALRARIAGTIENPDAAAKFHESAAMEDVRYRAVVGKTALDWQREHAGVKVADSINLHMESGRYDEAMRAFAHGKEAGLFSAAQQVSIPKAIRSAQNDSRIAQQEQYQSAVVANIGRNMAYGNWDAAEREFNRAVGMGALTDEQKVNIPVDIQQGRAVSGMTDAIDRMNSTGQVDQFRAVVNRTPVLTEAQKKSLQSQLDDRAEDIVMSRFRQIIEDEGMVEAARAIDDLNRASPDSMGLRSEKDKEAIIGRLDAVVNDYEERTAVAASAANADRLKTFIGQVEGAEGLVSARDVVNNQLGLVDEDREALLSSINQRVEDDLTVIVRNTVEESGLDVGRRAIGQINKTPWEEMGFSSDEEKQATVKSLRSIWKDYQFAMKEDKAAIEQQNRVEHIDAGGLADRREQKDRDAVESLFVRDTEGMDPYGDAWNGVVQDYAAHHGWIPDSVEAAIRSGLDSGNPNANVAAANTVAAIDAVAPRALDHINQNDIELAYSINERSRTGAVPPVETIAKIRDGLEMVPDAIRSARRAEFSQMISADPEATLKELVENGGPENPWTRFAAEIPGEMQIEFNNMYAEEYERLGDHATARNLAYRQIRRRWGLTDFNDRLRLQRYSPHAMTDKGLDAAGNPQPWVQEQFMAEMSEGGVQLEEEYNLVFNEANPQAMEWFVIQRNADGDLDYARFEDGDLVTWTPEWKSSPQAKREEQTSARNAYLAKVRAKREREIEATRGVHPIYGEGGLTVDDYKAAGKWVSRTANAAAIRGYEFIFDDIPAVWDKMPHRKMERMRREKREKENFGLIEQIHAAQ